MIYKILTVYLKGTHLLKSGYSLTGPKDKLFEFDMVTRITSLVKNALSKSLTRLFTAEKFDFAPVLLRKERLLNPH